MCGVGVGVTTGWLKWTRQMCRDHKLAGKLDQANGYRSQLGKYNGPSKYVANANGWIKQANQNVLIPQTGRQSGPIKYV